MAYPCSDDPQEVISQILDAAENSEKLDSFVNGTDSETVQLGSGTATPVLRNVVRQMMSAGSQIEGTDASGKFVLADGTTETRTLASRFADVVNVKDFGAKGDGETDDTAAIQAALDCDVSTVFFPDGIFSVSELFLTKKKKILLAEAAVVKANTPFQRRFSLLTVGAGADGSVISGGVFDGNRAELASSYAERDWLWRLLEIKIASDVTVNNVTMQNSTANSIAIGNAPRTRVDGLRVFNCTKWFEMGINCDNTIITNVVAKDLSNGTSDVYAHGCEIRRSSDITISDVHIYNYSPLGEYQRESAPTAMSLDRITGLNLSNIVIDGYGGSSSSGLHFGLRIEGSSNINASNIVVKGFIQGIAFHRCASVKLDNFIVDGEYTSNTVNSGNNQGLIDIQGVGVAKNINAGDVQYQLSFGDVRLPGTACDISMSNGTVMRGRGMGMQIYGGHDVSISNVTVQAVDAHGIAVSLPSGYGSYAQYGQKDSSGKVKIYGCTFSCIGYSGIAAPYAENVDIYGCTFSWCSILARSSTQALYRYYVSGFNGCKSMSINNCSFSAVNPASRLSHNDVVSWMPDNYDSDTGLHTVFCGIPSAMPLGGVVKIPGATDNSDDTFKVISYDLESCEAQLEAVDTAVTSGFLVSGDVLKTVEISSVTTDAAGGSISGTADFSAVPPYAAVALVIDGTTYWRNNANTGTAGTMALSVAVPANSSVTSVKFISATPVLYAEFFNASASTGSGDSSSANKSSFTGNKVARSFSGCNTVFISDSYETSSPVSIRQSFLDSICTKKHSTASNGNIVFGSGGDASGEYGTQINGNAYINASSILCGALFPEALWSGGESSDADTLVNLGLPNKRWNQVYAAVGTIQTSDARLKTSVGAPSDALMTAWGRVRFKIFQFTEAVREKGARARLHAGVIAQDVEAAFAAEGLDASRYGLLCHDEWPDKFDDVEVVDVPGEYDVDGTEMKAPVVHVEQRLVQKAGDRYGIRYEEALVLECAYQRWLGERRDAEIESLKTRVAALEAI